MARSIAQINKALAPHAWELVKGPGYFYFAPLPGALDDGDDPASLMCCSVAEISVAECLRDVTDHIARQHAAA